MILAILLSITTFNTGPVEATPWTGDPEYLHANWTDCYPTVPPVGAVSGQVSVTLTSDTSIVLTNPYPYPLVRINAYIGITHVFTGEPGFMYPSLGGIGGGVSLVEFAVYVPPYSTATVPIWTGSMPSPLTFCYGGGSSCTQTGLYPEIGLYYAPAYTGILGSAAWLTPDGRRWLDSPSGILGVVNYSSASGSHVWLDANGADL